MDKNIWILIPAYNEARKIASVIFDLKKCGYHNIFVVNDGSKDDTRKIAQSAGAEVLEHIINRGQGAAIRTGIEYLREYRNPNVIVTFDADGQHQTKDIADLIQPITNHSADIVLGSRFLKEKPKIPFFRNIILRCGILFTNSISHIHLSDTHNGLRALGKEAIKKICISHRGMEHASDIIDEIPRNKLRYKEVPVTIVYTDYSKSKGQKNSGFVKMGIKILLKKFL